MRFKRVGIGSLLLAAIGVAIAAQPGVPNDLVVHEWGTFLAMSGSDGVTLEGMYHEEHALPSFVHARSRDQLRLPSVVLKGETPVIYFYTEHAQKVRVNVGFPNGLWTQWYPQAQVVGPQFAQAATPPDVRKGRIMWCANLVPASASAPPPALPEPSKDALWKYARDVDAAFVQTTDRTKAGEPAESERFLFYRGLGKAGLPVRFTAARGGTLSSESAECHGVRDVFIIKVENGRGSYAYLPALNPGEQKTDVIPATAESLPFPEFSRRLEDHLASRLYANGLYPKEARAMVNTWRESYFKSEGIRALFILPGAWTDQAIPLTIAPKPKETVRVMVGRIELLAPERERAAEQAVNDLASPDETARDRAFDVLRGQGRYVEPVLRRVLATAQDEKVRALCRRLLLTDFVTELRAAIHAPGDGSRINDEPVFARAQLAVLLKEVGLNDEAKAEGKAVIDTLRQRPQPPMDKIEARSYLRALARATDATGDDREASEWYGRYIEYGSQVATKRSCVGCHADAGPRDLAWFRDWWAGPRYARATLASGLADKAVESHEATLASGKGDPATRLKLAYLYEAKGAHAQARALWSQLLGPDVLRSALAGAKLPSGPEATD